MLENITFMLKIHGINYYLSTYHSTILRMVLPVEILNYVEYGECGREFYGVAM